jgi:hypothetical protein
MGQLLPGNRWNRAVAQGFLVLTFGSSWVNLRL